MFNISTQISVIVFAGGGGGAPLSYLKFVTNPPPPRPPPPPHPDQAIPGSTDIMILYYTFTIYHTGVIQ